MITKMEIAALKQAEHVCFRLNDGKSVMEATAKKTNKNPFGGCVIIHVNTLFHCYASADHHTDIKLFRGFETVWDYEEYFKSIVSLLKEGDIIYLRWHRDGFSSPVLNDAGLHGDKLSMMIQRGEKKLIFSISDSISPDNTARMIRRIG